MSHQYIPSSPAAQWRAAFSAARSGRVYLDQPMIHQALTVLVASQKSSLALSHQRWLTKSIPDLAAVSRSSRSAVDLARWLVPARAALYAAWQLRRVGGAS